jgi:hypothetical protein
LLRGPPVAARRDPSNIARPRLDGTPCCEEARGSSQAPPPTAAQGQVAAGRTDATPGVRRPRIPAPGDTTGCRARCRLQPPSRLELAEVLAADAHLVTLLVDMAGVPARDHGGDGPPPPSPHLSPLGTSHGRSRHGARGRMLQDPDMVALGAGMEHGQAFTFWRRSWAASHGGGRDGRRQWQRHRKQRLLLGFPIATVPTKSRATSSLRTEEGIGVGIFLPKTENRSDPNCRFFGSVSVFVLRKIGVRC